MGWMKSFFHHLYFICMALMTNDKVTWTSTCHSPMLLGRNHYAYNYKMIMNNDADA
jgi:hypothetical protein